MSVSSSIRNVLVPIHPEGYKFIAAFFVASVILGFIWGPLFWIGMLLTAWCAWFFRDPPRVTPVNDDFIIAPADGKISHITKVVPPAELGLGDEPVTEQIEKDVWGFSQHIQRLVEEKHKELEAKYPEWFNENLKLHVQLIHPLNRPPSNHSPCKGKHTIIKQLSSYLKPYFITKTGIAEMIAQIFLYFYGRDYPEIDPKKIAIILQAPNSQIKN